ncbi:MAG: hypothetical protein ACE5EH_11790 [Gammaproteobacteria bacterium]
MTERLDNQVGLYGEYNYMMTGNSFIGVKMTLIDYEIIGIAIDGNSFGAYVGMELS